MRILIDADGCPVVEIILAEARRRGTECVIFCDTSHEIDRDGARTVTVARGADSADFALVNEIRSGDIVVTQDYGLAAMALARGARPIREDGLRYASGNIDALLLARHEARRVRQGGGRLKGPRKRTRRTDAEFLHGLQAALEEGP